MAAEETKKNLGLEKRLYPRRRLRSRVVFEDEWGEGFIYFYSTDVSLGGIFLESDVPLKQGTKVFLSFKLGDAENPIRATAQVVRLAKESADAITIFGMGVQFLDLSTEAKEAIADYLGDSSEKR
ncbi:MAG: PilZ domain-containing protein [Deltaproteobacteria bacterium]|nr:PilZ domain-containing protein [Deltaproteobacteria bacterium]